MSQYIMLYFNLADPKNSAEALSRRIGDDVHFCEYPDGSSQWAFSYFSQSCSLSTPDIEMVDKGLDVRDYNLCLQIKIPTDTLFDMFSLMYALLLKELHYDMGIKESVLCWDLQSFKAHFVHPDGFSLDSNIWLFNKLSGKTVSYAELPLFIRKIGEDAGAVSPLP